MVAGDDMKFESSGEPTIPYFSYDSPQSRNSYHFQYHNIYKTVSTYIVTALAVSERDHAESEASPCGCRATSIRSLAVTAVTSLPP